MVWLDCSVWADRSTVLVGPDGLTWLLCMGWQIHCPIHCPGWSWWWSDLTALYGLTDPLFWLVLMVWLDCFVWAYGWHFLLHMVAEDCNSIAHITFHDSTIIWNKSYNHVNCSMTEIQACNEFQPPSLCAHPRIYFIDNNLLCSHLFMAWIIVQRHAPSSFVALIEQ